MYHLVRPTSSASIRFLSQNSVGSQTFSVTLPFGGRQTSRPPSPDKIVKKKWVKFNFYCHDFSIENPDYSLHKYFVAQIKNNFHSNIINQFVWLFSTRLLSQNTLFFRQIQRKCYLYKWKIIKFNLFKEKTRSTLSPSQACYLTQFQLPLIASLFHQPLW